jgi:hypothetical protein
MHSNKLQDRLYKGLNTAARIVGVDTNAFRPSTPSDALAPVNRFLRLRATFTTRDGGFEHANGYGQATWYGVFDAAYTQPGDYLVQKQGVWFIAAQPLLAPILCVRTNRSISIMRHAVPSNTGLNSYGGSNILPNILVLENWPASVLGSTSGDHPKARLPSDMPVPYWTILLPAFGQVILCTGDFISDDLGRNAVVAAAELTDLGWRIAARQATT